MTFRCAPIAGLQEDRELARGESSRVFAATWLGKKVAVKQLWGAPSASRREEFLAQAARLAQIDHPSLVTLLAAGTLPDGSACHVMPLLDGPTLARWLQRGPLTQSHLFDLFGQVAGALSALHERGVFHRDLKTENVLVVGDGRRGVLIDLDLARESQSRIGTTTAQGFVRGTATCMAPERFFGTPADEKTEIYELAVLLYEMLCQRLPWLDSSDPAARLLPTRPSELGIRLPKRTEAVLLRALSARPERRPFSVRAFVKEVMT